MVKNNQLLTKSYFADSWLFLKYLLCASYLLEAKWKTKRIHPSMIVFSHT